MTYLKLFVLIY